MSGSIECLADLAEVAEIEGMERWIISDERGQLLGTHVRESPLYKADFGLRQPLLFNSLIQARRSWLQWSCRRGYLVRQISLPNEPIRHMPSPLFDLWPSVSFIGMKSYPVELMAPTKARLMAMPRAEFNEKASFRTINEMAF